MILSDEGQAKLLDFGIAKFVRVEGQAGPAEISNAAGAVTADEHTRRLPAQQTDLANDPDQTRPEDGPIIPGSGEETVAAVPAANQAGQGWPAEAEDPIGLTDPGMLLGSPRYMAPEMWLGEPATFRSDVYSFGALLYALIAGQPPHSNKDLAALREMVCTRDAAPLSGHCPQLDPAFAAIVDRCLRRNPAQRHADGNEVRSALARITTSARNGALPAGNPYRGLRAFEAEHQNLFFGRDSETRFILERLAAEPFVLVVGDSGVGKSSLCRAGVLSRVSVWLGRSRTWEALTLVPGSHPVSSLAAALASWLEEDESDWERRIVEDPGGVGRRLRARLGRRGGLVLFIDQLEEVLTLSDPTEREAVARALAWLASPTPGLRLLATIRGDFLSRLANLEPFGDEISRAIYFLRPLSAERIREAIVGPARAKGVAIESQEPLDGLVCAAEQSEGGLPLLQFALAELWDARGEGPFISADSLQAIGGVVGALARHADRVLAQMLPRERAVAREVLLALVRRDGTRARKTAVDLGCSEQRNWAVLDALVRGRLIATRESSGAYGYEIAHEALVSGWPTLAQWLSADAEARAVHERMRQAAAEWELLGRDADLLWSGRQVREADALDRSVLGAPELSFLAASRRRQRRVRVFRLGALLGVPLLIGLVWAGLALKERIDRDARVDARLGRADRLLERAAALRVRTDALRDDAFGLFDRPDLAAGERAWDACMQSAGELSEHHEQAGQQMEAAMAIDPGRDDVRSRFADLLLARSRLAERFHQERDLAELLRRLELYDQSGQRLRSWHGSGRIRIRLDPRAAAVELFRWVRAPDGSLRQEPMPFPARQNADLSLPAGSYLLTARAAGRAAVRYPFLLDRGQELELAFELPPDSAVPPGFVYVPPGRFLFGTAVEDGQRREFFHHVPLHPVETGGYLVARYETTFADWIAFLEDLEPAERAARAPRLGAGGFQGTLSLRLLPDGVWELAIQPTLPGARRRADHLELAWLERPGRRIFRTGDGSPNTER